VHGNHMLLVTGTQLEIKALGSKVPSVRCKAACRPFCVYDYTISRVLLIITRKCVGQNEANISVPDQLNCVDKSHLKQAYAAPESE